MPSFLTRVTARLRGLTPEDYAGEPGSKFRRMMGSISAFFKRNGLTGEDLARNAGIAAEGAANEKLAKAVKDFAETEQTQVNTALLLRTFEADARIKVAGADRAEAEADLAKTAALSARLDLLQRLKELGIALVELEGDRIAALPAPAHIDVTDVKHENDAPEGELVNAVLDIRIEELNFSERIYTRLKAMKILTLGDLASLSQGLLWTIGAFDDQSLFEVRDKLAEHGLELKE